MLRLLDIHLHTTRLSLRTSFDQQAAGAVLDMEGDEGTEMKKSKSLRKWYSTAFGYVTIFFFRGTVGRVWGRIYNGKFTMGKRVEGGRGRFFLPVPNTPSCFFLRDSVWLTPLVQSKAIA